MKRRSRILLTILMATVALTSCARQPSRQNAKKDTTLADDGLRIASLAPSSTSIIVALGLAERLVAVDQWSATLPGVSESALRLDLMRPDVERLAALSPDLLIVSPLTQASSGVDPFRALSDSGIRVVSIPTSGSLTDVSRDVRAIAALVSRGEEGERIVADMERSFAEARERAASIPPEKRRSVYFEIEAAPSPYTFGRGVYLDELLEAAGARNVFSDLSGWVSVGPEAIVSRDPDVILTNVDYLPDPVAEIRARPGWSGMKAVREGRVYLIDPRTSARPAPELVEALREIERAVYPERFDE